MSSFQRSLKHTKALIEAFRRPTTQVRCFKAPSVVRERGQTFLRDPQCLTSPPMHRWSTSTLLIPRAAPQLPAFESLSNSSAFFASASSPAVDGKDSNPSPSSESATTTSEESAEPVKPTGGSGQKMEDAEAVSGEIVTSEDVSREELVGLLGEKLALLEQKSTLLEEKSKEARDLKERLLWSLAEMENVRHRTKREAESTRKFAVQTFGKDLLDVADNLSRAIGAVPEEVVKADPATDTSGSSKVLQALLQGVVITEKQLLQVYKKHGFEKYESKDQPFDPNRHSAVFEVQDTTKAAGTVAIVLKDGYLLHDRVVRPAEVAVVKAAEE